jgi:transcriptional regulator with XRE-family HTH domain
MSKLFAPELKIARLKAGKTQAQLAEQLDLGKSSISQIESGTRETTTDVVERWLAACAHTMTIAPCCSPAQIASLVTRIERALIDADPHQMHVFEALVQALEHQNAKKM